MPHPRRPIATSAHIGGASGASVDSFAYEPILKAAAGRTLPVWTLWAPLLTLFAIITVPAVARGNFFSSGGWSRFLDDLKIFLLSSNLQGSPAFPLLRDYPSILTVFAAGTTVPLMFASCGHVERLIMRVSSWNSDPMRGSGRASLEEIQKSRFRAREQYEWLGRFSVVTLLGSAVVMLAVYAAAQRSRHFAILSQPFPPSGPFRWWADAHFGGVASTVCYLVTGSLCIYIFAKHNAFGYILLAFFMRIRNVDWTSVDILNEDTFYGWGDLRKLLLNVYLAILTSGLAVGFQLGYLSNIFAWAASPVSILFFLSIPLNAILPLILLRSRMERERAIRGRELRVQYLAELRELEEEKQSSAAKHHNRREMPRQGLIEAVASLLTRSWRGGSSDGSANSVGLQHPRGDILEAQTRLLRDYEAQMRSIRGIRCRMFRPSQYLAAFTAYAVPIVGLFSSKG